MEPSNRVELELRLDTPAGAIDLRLQVPRGPMRLSGLASFAQAVTDRMVEQAIRQERSAGRELSCAAGCGACCAQLVPLSAPEAFVLADYVVALPPAERDDVIERFDSIGRRLEQRGAKAMLEQLLRSSEQSDLSTIAREYFALSLPCPLLTAASCSVYEHRPLVCRSYNVTSPAAWCADPPRHSIAHVPVPPIMSPLLAQLTAELSGSEPQLIPMALALDWAEQHAELAMRSWPGVDLLGDLLARLGVGQAPARGR